jgi:hypothetical protein
MIDLKKQQGKKPDLKEFARGMRGLLLGPHLNINIALFQQFTEFRNLLLKIADIFNPLDLWHLIFLVL